MKFSVKKMKYRFTLLVIFSFHLIFAQKQPIPNKSEELHHQHGPICKIGEPMPGFVIPANAKSRTIPENAAIFEVTYTSEVPAAGKSAMNRATTILSDLFASPIPVSVRVSTFDSTNNTLAFAFPGANPQNFQNAPIENTRYPIALAEKLAGMELNTPNSPYDIEVRYNTNSSLRWNFTSVNVAEGQFDFVTVILHELLHGLGFSGSSFFNGNNNLGTLRTSNLPSSYSNALENRDGQNLVATFDDPSTALGVQLQSNNVYIKTASFAANNDRAKVYAPGNYSGGSSISHLDETTYRNTPHSLMKPSIAPGAIIHNPGSIALNILYDLGWSFTNVVHEHELGQEDVTQPLEVKAMVISDQGYDPATTVLHYSQDTFKTETSLNMASTGTPDEFIAAIPAPNKLTVYQYYISVNDNRNIQFTSPAGAPLPTFHQYFYILDNTLPEIVHEPTTKVGDTDKEFPLDASVTDFFTGVEEVFIEYKINGALRTPVFMEKDTTDEFRPDLYSGIISLPRTLVEGSLFEYRIVANDKSSQNNTRTSPTDGGFYKVDVTQIRDAASLYVNDFETALTDFNGDGFSVTNPSGFNDNAIHSTHPYTNAGLENTRNFTYNLSIPIIIRKTEALIEFDEIVLVEPSDLGTKFGDTNFWDYVIVEGRKIDNSEWIPFLDGYDSRANAAWLSTYNNNSQGQNSAATGNNGLYRARIIDMQESGDFVEGDTVLIRFRLFSDPFAVGWGWAIDNLNIQDTQVAIEEFIEAQDFLVYPNPIGQHFLTVEADFKKSVKEINVQISNIHGQLLYQQNFSTNSQRFAKNVEVHTLPKGVYLLTLKIDNQEQITKRIIRP